MTNSFVQIRKKIHAVIPSPITGHLTDRSTVLLALTVDSRCHGGNTLHISHTFSSSSMASCPDLPRCIVAASFSLVMLYGRKAVVFLFAYKMTKEKNWLKLPWFAHTASAWWHAVSRISLSKRFVWAFSYKGCITAADAMYDDTAIFWTRRFIYRLPSCFWGLEMFFEIIQLFVRCLGRGRETDTNIHVRCLA